MKARAASILAGRKPEMGRVPSQVCGPEPGAVTWVEFHLGRRGTPIGRVCGDVDTPGLVVLPARHGPQPQPGELWLVEPWRMARSGRALIVRLLRRTTWAELEAMATHLQAEDEARAKALAREARRQALDGLAWAYGSANWEEFQRQFAEATRAYDGRIAPSLEVTETGDCAQVYAVVTYDDGAVERSPVTTQRLERLRELATAEGLEYQADPHTRRQVQRARRAWEDIRHLRGGALAAAVVAFWAWLKWR